jgi:hypothetical protein
MPGPAQAQGAVKLFIAKRFDPLPATCNFTLPEYLNRCTGPAGCISECSGNTLSDGLILAAAHCFDYNFMRLRFRRMLRDVGYPNDIADDPCGINDIKVRGTMATKRMMNWGVPRPEGEAGKMHAAAAAAAGCCCYLGYGI